MSSVEANVWMVRPQEVCDDQMRLIEGLLDPAELERAARFRFDEDRRAYVVAHGLRRIVLGDLLGVDPARLMISRRDSGQPQLIWPERCEVYFSHSHTRELVAFAAGAEPLGIDVECVTGVEYDFELLEPYLILPPSDQRAAELGENLAGQFFFYWTVLESFWKAQGKGLSTENPRICCERNRERIFEITVEDGGLNAQAQVFATVSRIEAPRGCVVSLAQRRLHGTTRIGCSSFHLDAESAGKKDKFFQRIKRYQDSDLVTMVSV